MNSTMELINIELNDTKEIKQHQDNKLLKEEELRLKLEEEDNAYFNSIYKNNNLNNFFTYI